MKGQKLNIKNQNCNPKFKDKEENF